MNAPYTGGFAPFNFQFAVDGNFYQCDPCSAPRISFPMKGDAIFSNQPVAYLNGGGYELFFLGDYPNVQPWSNNQRTFIVEQDFMVAMEAYQPLPLNTPYNWAWAIGWQSQLTNGEPIPELFYAVLVEEGNTEDMGQGIIKITRRFATLPPTRNEMEQFTYQFPGLDGKRIAFSRTVQSRLQYDYFINDDYGIYPYGAVWPAGPVLNATTGMYPAGIILNPQAYYPNIADAITNNLFLPENNLSADTIPTADQWNTWTAPAYGTGSAAEIVAEPSCMRRWMGNIWERRTRFVQAL